MLYKFQSEIDKSKIKVIQFDNIHCSLLYVDLAKKGHHRLVKYHILDASNFQEKGRKTAFSLPCESLFTAYYNYLCLQPKQL